MPSPDTTIKLMASHDYNTGGASLAFVAYAGEWPARLARSAIETWCDVGVVDGDPDLTAINVRQAVAAVGLDRAVEIYCAEHDALANGEYEDM